MSTFSSRREAEGAKPHESHPRFLTREQVADELNISMAQAYALIRRGDLRALKLGGRGTWRVGRDDLEAFIARLYEETERWIEEHPFDEDGPEGEGQ
jgi:excisionase family DNA binding protein